MDEVSRMITQRTRKDNISMQLLFPCIQIEQGLVRQFPEFGFVNTYLTCDKSGHHEVIYVVFKTEFTLPFYHFITQMEKNQNFLETIDEPGMVILVYRIPKHFKLDFYKFLDGRYSQYTPEFKACFPLERIVIDPKTGAPKRENGRYISEKTEFYHIFYKTKDLRDRWSDALGTEVPENMELYDKPDQAKETLIL